MIRAYTGALPWLLALLSGVLLTLLHPPFELTYVTPLVLVPLLLTLAREGRPKRRFLLGYSAGVVYWFGVCTWIQFTLEVHGAMGKVGGWAVFVLFCLAKAIHLGVFSLLAPVLLRHWFAMPAIAALWVAIERTHGTFGFAWLTLGDAGVNMGVPLRLAPWVGTYGLSFLFALMNVAFALLLLRRPRTHLLWLGLLSVLALLPPVPEPANGTEQAVVVQPNFDPAQNWTDQRIRNEVVSLSQLSALTADSASRVRLVVWPEVPAPFYYGADPQFRQQTETLARRLQRPFLFGTVQYTPENRPLNSAVLLNAQGRFAGQYDKVNLVPFGEFVPPLFSFVNRITSEISDFVPGTRVIVFDVEGTRTGVFICYESVFPQFVRQFALQGAEVLFNLSNDGYFGKSAARRQHLKLVRMRAAENRRWIVRATNDGFTVSIDPAGRIASELPPYERAARPLAYSPVTPTTFYTRHGDWFVGLCALIAAAALFSTQVPRYEKPQPRLTSSV